MIIILLRFCVKGQAEFTTDKKIKIDCEEYNYFNSRSPFGFFSFGPTSDALKRRVHEESVLFKDPETRTEFEHDTVDVDETWTCLDTWVEETDDIENLSNPVPKVIIEKSDSLQTR